MDNTFCSSNNHDAEYVELYVQEMLEKHQEFLQRQREAVKYRLKKLASRQSEITRASSVIKESIIRVYQEIHEVLDEDLRVTLCHLEMEERATVSTLDGFMEKSCSLIQVIERDLAHLTAALDRTATHAQFLTGLELRGIEKVDRVMDVLHQSDPSGVSLDEAKAEQIVGLTNSLLLNICSQTPTAKKLVKSYSSDVCLDPNTAHPKLIISPQGDSVTYTDTWKEVADVPERFDATLNVLSVQSFDADRHYWEIDVTGKNYWEIGVTYPTIPRKGPTEDCWLGRGRESWCVEFFDGEYTAWHGGVPHQLPDIKPLCRMGVLCSFPAGLVTFLEAENMTPLFSFCAGRFSDRLHLALCPGHDHNGTNAKPLVICSPPCPTTELG